ALRQTQRRSSATSWKTLLRFEEAAEVCGLCRELIIPSLPSDSPGCSIRFSGPAKGFRALAVPATGKRWRITADWKKTSCYVCCKVALLLYKRRFIIGEVGNLSRRIGKLLLHHGVDQRVKLAAVDNFHERFAASLVTNYVE